MARLWTVGFEMNDIVGIEFQASGALEISTTTVRSGTYALRIAGLVSGTAEFARFHYAAANSLVDYYSRAYLRIETLPTAENRICLWGNSTGVQLAWITLDQNGLLRLYDEDGVIGSASAALSLNRQYRIEMRFNTAPAAGSMIITARIDGVEFATSSTRSISTGGTTFRVGGNLGAEAQTQGVWYFDDCAVNNVSGTVQNTYPGEGRIVCMHPDAAGDFAEGTRGGADSGASWSQVNEVTPNDATNYHTLVTAGDRLDVNLESPIIRGINPFDKITLVEVVARVSALTAASCSHNERIKSQASGLLFDGTSVAIGVTAWNIQDDAEPRHGQCVSYDDPQNGGEWTPLLLSTAQIGITASDATPDLLCSTLIAIVEYLDRPIFGVPFGLRGQNQMQQLLAT